MRRHSRPEKAICWCVGVVSFLHVAVLRCCNSAVSRAAAGAHWRATIEEGLALHCCRILCCCWLQCHQGSQGSQNPLQLPGRAVHGPILLCWGFNSTVRCCLLSSSHQVPADSLHCAVQRAGQGVR